MTDALKIEHLTCRYGDKDVLKDLSLTVEKGDIICLLGASGCGKTTLLKCLAGLIPIADGTLMLGDRLLFGNHVNVPTEDRHIGMIFQDYALFPHLTVAKNVAFGLVKESKDHVRAKVAEMLKLVHLTGLDERYPHELSGGQQQRVAIARALAQSPGVLLLDEPFSNIDTQVRFELIADIRRIFKKEGITAIFVTHSREEAFAFADKMAVMHDGRIEQFGSGTELYHRPSTRFVANFLGTASYLPVRVVNGCVMTAEDRVLMSNVEAKDGAYDLMLRPEDLRVESDTEGYGRVTEVRFMGSHVRVTVDWMGSAVSVNADTPLAIGERVSVALVGGKGGEMGNCLFGI